MFEHPSDVAKAFARPERRCEPAPAFPFSRARFDGNSAHEARPFGEIASVVYEPDGSTTLTHTSGAVLCATGYGRGARLSLVTR